jgi:iron complex outermembrane receptor protein
MIKYLLLFQAFAFSVLDIAGQGTVRGKIYDSDTKEPLQGVYVIYEGDKGTTSDENGHYSISSVQPVLNLTFQFIGYSPVSKSVIIVPNDTVILDAGLKMKISEIGQIVVSAGRYEQKISELTVSMNLIKSKDFLNPHITDTRELINKTPGIEVLDGQASIRGGSGFSYGAGSRVLALIDGLPVLSPDAANIKWQFLPLENISQVEIIKGASSVLYGSSAMNGIINFRTADASSVPNTQFFAETGLIGKPADKEMTWWNSPRIFSDISFSHLQKYGKNDIGIGLNIRDNNGYRKYNYEKTGRLSLRFKHHNEKVKGLVYGMNINSGYSKKIDFVRWEDAGPGALKQDTSTVSLLNGSFLAADPYISFNNNGKFRHDLKIRLQSANNRFPVRKENNSDALSIYSEYQTNYNVSGLLNITAGIANNFSRVTSAFYGNHEGMTLAGFSQLEASPLRRLKVVAGIRVENNSLDGVNDRIVPVFRTGINWQAAENTFIRGSFGQGYRFPSIAEKFASTTLGSIRVIPNPDVKSESGWSSEAGIRQGLRFGKIHGQADLSVFMSQNKDLIEFTIMNYPYFGFQATNIEQSRIYGYEIEFLLNRKSGNINTTLNGGYTYIYPVEINPVTGKSLDKYLKYRSKHSIKINASASFKNLETGFSINAKSKIMNIDNVFLNEMTRELILPGFYSYWQDHNHGYFLIDFNIGYHITRSLTLSFAVKNITNAEYMGRPGDIQPPRNYSLRFSGNF